MPVPKKSLINHGTAPKNVSAKPAGWQSQGPRLTNSVTSNADAGNTWMNLNRRDAEEQMEKYREASNPPARGWWARLAKIFLGNAT